MSVKLLVATSKRRGSALLGRFGNTAFGLLLVVYMAVPVPEAVGEDASPPVPPNPSCCQAPPVTSGPAVWGVVGLMGYPTGKHEAPNGLAFEPLVGLTSDFNIELLSRKQLYLFWESDLWVQSGAVGAPAASLREFDGELGAAWNYFDSLEFRASAYSLNNVNRGFSLARPDGYKDGWKIENRYYFGSGDIYDTGTLPFVGIAIIRPGLWWGTMARYLTQVYSPADT